MMKSRSILIYLSVLFKGDWQAMMDEFKTKKTCVKEEDVKKIEDMNLNALTILDPDYPDILKHIDKPPFVLYYKGDKTILNNGGLKYLAVVGSRLSTPYGENMTHKIISNIDKSVCIISGLAKGIDRKAHIEALNNKLKTIAVLGTGIDVVYPACNKELFKRIVDEGGLILSEYPFDTEGSNQTFLVRNRIIAALSKCTLLIESYDRSGAVNTVNYAIYYGKNVCCVPLPALKESNNNKLLKDGAALVENAKDVEQWI